MILKRRIYKLCVLKFIKIEFSKWINNKALKFASLTTALFVVSRCFLQVLRLFCVAQNNVAVLTSQATCQPARDASDGIRPSSIWHATLQYSSTGPTPGTRFLCHVLHNKRFLSLLHLLVSLSYSHLLFKQIMYDSNSFLFKNVLEFFYTLFLSWF